MIDKHKDKRKYNNFGYHSTKFWLKGNDTWMKNGRANLCIVHAL